MTKLRNSLNARRARQETSLISFIMAGLPNPQLCLDCIKAIEQGGGDALELGVPFSDPLADGVVIERFHHRGINAGLNLKHSLDFADKVRQAVNIPLVLFAYYNPILQMGMEVLAQACQAVGIEALIVPDLPLDEIKQVHTDLEFIPMVAPSSPDERLDMAAAMNPSFIYCVSVRGVTGVRSLPEDEVKAYLQKLKPKTDAILALGFGISSPEQIKTFKNSADAVVVGSYLAQIMEEYESRPQLLPTQIEKAIAALKKPCAN
ncbi:Aldolase-type TIM barrel [Syntrophomonas zehnderi OL-4]|uniref:Tryptophan synthase alpha chain n=1 Tax=Syntrophomonas zehnderi OL-4 TaxID=690567 RepID=A0A0E4GBZ6_9FIRM|nr:tryptophan synthase subunit alpha [Syntrophomonas zehnderi]CFX98252.1 Aldolase-type TIM barrel [Syntrophomonas zehnderi OL-4]